MPTTTRAALRSTTILEDELGLAMSTALPATPPKDREPLGEVAGNVSEDTVVVEDVVQLEKKGGAKGKKAKRTKKGKKQPKFINEATPEVVEDDNQSATSSAVEEACGDLMKPNAGATNQIPMQDRPTTPQSPAVDVARKHLTPKLQTPLFDPDIHGSEDSNMKALANNKEDSFVGAIVSRTPAKITRTEIFDSERKDENARNDSEDSFVEKIVARSPAKSTSRIEDSVDAIDALEDAIEEIGECLPAVSADAQSPATDKKASKTSRGQTKATTPKPATKENSTASAKSALNKVPASRPSTVKRTPIPPPSKTLPSRPSHISNVRASLPATSRSTPPAKTPRQPGTAKTSTTAKPARQLNTTRTSTATKPPTTRTSTATKPPTTTSTAAKSPPTTSPAAKPPPTTTSTPLAPPPSTARPLPSTHKPPFQPTKSLKPPTRPSFSLPGDAITRKLQEARSARQRADEAAAAQKRQFKARPVRLSHAPVVVKNTVASRARLSLLGGDKGGGVGGGAGGGVRIRPLGKGGEGMGEGKGNGGRKEGGAGANGPDGRGVGARVSSVDGGAPCTGRANADAAAGGEVKATATAKSKGKAVFERERVELERREVARREGEVRAKRAREEAAERGRAASRVWAGRMAGRVVGGGKVGGGVGEVKEELGEGVEQGAKGMGMREG